MNVSRVMLGGLVLLALGPTATVLAARLVKVGVQALDVGHIDVEDMWYLMGGEDKGSDTREVCP